MCSIICYHRHVEKDLFNIYDKYLIELGTYQMLNTNEKLTAKSAFGTRIILLLIYALRCCLLLGQFDIMVPLWRGVRVV